MSWPVAARAGAAVALHQVATVAATLVPPLSGSSGLVLHSLTIHCTSVQPAQVSENVLMHLLL